MFKHILQYLRAFRDQQPFVCGESLARHQLAAIAAEAHFYGLADLEEAIARRSSRGEYEYKYLAIGGHGVSEYKPTVQIDKSHDRCKRTVYAWQSVGQEYGSEDLQPAPDNNRRKGCEKTDLGADPGNLLHLHSEGWEHVHGHPYGSLGGFVVVLRRRL